ncbi:hypothetical protein BKA65DRAFT_497483 [Rhexocercosporidium sp. MPI-PUGE-AT-0058]|nr:hypothetical protein BKA65DRAFT_497483 [Rhexocercosporidium sp. MPI-PUGE-AT-0058]
MNRPFNGDLSELIEKGWKNYRALSQAPQPLKALSDAVLSLIGMLRLTHDATQDAQLSATDQWVINSQKGACSLVFEQLQGFIYGLRSQRLGFEGVGAIETKILDQTGQLSSFLEVLQGPPKQNISNALSKIPDIQSVAATWEDLQAEIQKFGFSERLIQDNFFFIDSWLKDNVTGASEVTEQSHDGGRVLARGTRDLAAGHMDYEEEELPGYTPGARRGTIEEKVQSLEQTTLIMNHSEPIDMMATSSKAPPAYTFEEGHDEQVDQVFDRYIKEAVDNEVSRRAIERIHHPDAEARAYSWLPKAMQSQYTGREDIVSLLEPNSFSVMAHETAPRCNEEIERLMSLLRVTFEHKNLSQSAGVVNDAFKCLDSMSKAISKFMLLQDQHGPASEAFSDMDALDFEYSTAAGLGDTHQFPTKEFEFCQKSYYRLLTYIMGMLEAFAYIFQGRTYISRSRHELEYLWKDKKMDIRTAWLDKQLAGWDEVEGAVLFVRDWRAVRPIIRYESLQALRDWKTAEKMLSGSEGDDTIEMTIVSATRFPKSTFGRPSLLVKVVLFVATRIGQMRALELKTDIVSKSQDPIWNKAFDIAVPKNSKWIDVEVHDRVAGIESQIGRVRIPFSFIPGVEANFADKSLMYGIDEELEFPVPLIGKGKEVRPPMIKLRLKWTGRHAKLHESMLPFAPPGKMFKQNHTGIPLSQEQRDAMNTTGLALRPSNVSNRSEGSGSGGRVAAEASVNVTLGILDVASNL